MIAPMLALALVAAEPAARPSDTPAPVVAVTPPGEKPVDPYAQSDANAGAVPVRGSRAFSAFHGRDGVQRIADHFVDRVEADPRIKDIFAAADTVRLKRTLGEQFCYLLNGGCTYTGRDMRAAHRGQGLQNTDFNALVEDLQTAMDGEHVPFRDQNVLLAKLAPMQRVVVERKSPALVKSLRRRLARLGGGS